MEPSKYLTPGTKVRTAYLDSKLNPKGTVWSVLRCEKDKICKTGILVTLYIPKTLTELKLDSGWVENI